MKKYVLVAVGGALGSIFRWGISYLLQSENGFPFATLFVNLFGSFCLVYLYSRLSRNHENTFLFFATGFLGSFTTFSTFSVELVGYIQDEFWLKSLLYFFISSIGGLSFGLLGYKLGQRRGSKEENLDV
ncbi:fluoride efflux transporter FluC [Rossellomorea aquimaris]|uniref:fluoride efflux transporter FluC n=1 Tax=Rossellomorea aquimaris TaxID=189382 RepID=UPI0007D0B5C5|nr:CrcB family protein [Rossellomorea aquimaris]